MARYIGDLTAPDNLHVRIEVAQMLTDLADQVRLRRVRSLDIGQKRYPINVVPLGGVSPAMSQWDITITADTKGRHEA